MKILQMIPAFYPAMAYGGTVNVAYNMCKELVKRGHEVTVFTSDAFDKDSRQKEKYAIIDGIEVYYFRNISNKLAWSRFVLNTGVISALHKNIKYFDIIHLHGYRNFQNIFCYYYANRYKVPYVLQAHGSLPHFNQKQLMKKSIDSIIGYKILQNASRVIALNKTEADQYKKMGVVENKIEIVPNGIDLSEYERLPERGQLRKRYNIKDNEKIVLYLGRIHRTKGIDLLIAAYSELVKDIQDTRLVIVGPDDGHLSELKKQTIELGIVDKVVFTGPLFKQDKLAAFVDADVFVTPKFSGLPVTFIEACACGLPVITTTEGDDIDWINKNVGFVVEYSVSSISKSIVKLLQDDKLQRRFVNKGKDLVQNELNWGKIVNIIEKVYFNLIVRK